MAMNFMRLVVPDDCRYFALAYNEHLCILDRPYYGDWGLYFVMNSVERDVIGRMISHADLSQVEEIAMVGDVPLMNTFFHLVIDFCREHPGILEAVGTPSPPPGDSSSPSQHGSPAPSQHGSPVPSSSTLGTPAPSDHGSDVPSSSPHGTPAQSPGPPSLPGPPPSQPSPQVSEDDATPVPSDVESEPGVALRRSPRRKTTPQSYFVQAPPRATRRKRQRKQPIHEEQNMPEEQQLVAEHADVAAELGVADDANQDPLMADVRTPDNDLLLMSQHRTSPRLLARTGTTQSVTAAPSRKRRREVSPEAGPSGMSATRRRLSEELVLPTSAPTTPTQTTASRKRKSTTSTDSDDAPQQRRRESRPSPRRSPRSRRVTPPPSFHGNKDFRPLDLVTVESSTGRDTLGMVITRRVASTIPRNALGKVNVVLCDRPGIWSVAINLVNSLEEIPEPSILNVMHELSTRSNAMFHNGVDCNLRVLPSHLLDDAMSFQDIMQQRLQEARTLPVNTVMGPLPAV